MRLVDPAPVTLVSIDTTPDDPRPRITFRGRNGEMLRVSVITQDIIRVQMNPDGAYRNPRTWMIQNRQRDVSDPVPRAGNDRDAVLHPYAQGSFIKLEQHDDTITLHTDALRLVITLSTFSLRWFDCAGVEIASDLDRGAYVYDRSTRAIFHYMKLNEGARHYGLGEVAGPLDKTGMRIRLDPRDALGYNAETTDPLYKHYPFYITFEEERYRTYGMLYDNFSPAAFDFGKEIDYTKRSRYRYAQFDDGDLDYYFLYSSVPYRHLEYIEYLLGELVGAPAEMPKWAFGYLGSTMKYTEAPDAQEQLKKFAELCQQHDIPCDLFHLSSGYTTDQEGRRNVFTWNTDRIPDPRAMFDDFHKAGIRVAPNVKPHLLTTHPDYADLAARGGFILDAEKDEPAISQFWAGGAGTTAPGSLIDFTSEAGYQWWKDKIRTQLLEYGADAIWNDNNEYQMDDTDARCQGYGTPIRLSMMRPVQTLLMARASYEALKEFRPDEPPLVISRSGGMGIQRYAQTWSGDNETSWHTLKWNIPMGLSLSLSGQPIVGHDVGGFYGPAPDPELFVRWVQNGIFHPRFCIHSWNTDGTVNEPWMHPDVLPHVRAAIHLRYRLLKYLYDASVWMMMTPTMYEFEDDPRTRSQYFEFMLDHDLLVAPVYEPEARTREVYLPGDPFNKNISWCDFYTGIWYEGGQTVTVDAPLDRCPLFVRDGTLILMGKVMRYVGEQPEDFWQNYVFINPTPPNPDRQFINCKTRISITDSVGVGNQCEKIEQALKVTSELFRHDPSDATVPSFTHVEFVFPPGETREIIGGEPMEDLIEWGYARRRVRVPVT